MEESQLQNSKSDNFWSFLSCYFFQLRRHITNFFDCSLREQTREKSTYSFCRRLSKNCLFYTSFFLCFITVVQCAIATTFGLGGRKGWKILSKSCTHCLPRVQKECRIGFLIGSLQYLFSTWDVFYLYLFCFKFIKLDSNVQLPYSYSWLLDCLEKSCAHCLSNVQRHYISGLLIWSLNHLFFFISIQVSSFSISSHPLKQLLQLLSW